MKVKLILFWILSLATLVCLYFATLAAQTTRYTYDDSGRLIQVEQGNDNTIAYTYDKAGNLLERIVLEEIQVPDTNESGPDSDSSSGGCFLNMLRL